MNERIKRAVDIAPRLLSAVELQEYLSLGKNAAVQLAEEAGSRVCIGRRVLYDRPTLDKFIDKIMAEAKEA